MTFTGWNEGMMKVSFTKLLHHDGGLTLKYSKEITDGILNSELFTIKFKDEITAKLILNKSIEYYVDCELTD